MANESTNNNSELKEFFVTHGTKLGIVLVVIMAIVVGVVQYNEYRKGALDAQAENLGLGMERAYFPGAHGVSRC